MSHNLIRDGVVYFTASELQCHESGILNLAPGFGDKLLDFRVAFGAPMKINSCCRSTQHNRAVGGAPGSYHIADEGKQCCAVDVACSTGEHRARLVRLALDTGWSVGVKNDIVHLDRRTDYGAPKQLLFLYGRS